MLKPEKLKWDSDFFKLSIGQVNVKSQNEIEYGITVDGFDLVYIVSDILLDSTKQYSYHGTKVKFRKILREENDLFIKNIQHIDFDYYNAYQDIINNIAYSSGYFSRFNQDSQFGRKRFQILYDQWIENALNNVHDNIFLVYKQNLTNIPVALLTGMINIDSEVSKVGLLGVDVNERGKKIGSSMLKYFEKEAMDNNQLEIEIYTQIENSNACRFYNAMGYDKENVQYIYHLWS